MAPNIFNVNLYKPKGKKGFFLFSSYIYLIYGALSLILIGGTISWLIYGFHMPQKKIIQNKKKLARFLKVESDELLGIINRLNERKRSYLQLKQETIPWYDKFFEISQSISKKIWLDKIEYQANVEKSKNRGKIIIKGFIYSTIEEEYYAEIGNFVMALNQSYSIQRDFESLKIAYIKKSNNRSIGNMEFEINGEMKILR